MIKKPRSDKMITRQKIIVFNPDAGTFHEARELTYHPAYDGPRDPIRVNPEPYPRKLITLDKWKHPAPLIAWLYTGCGERLTVEHGRGYVTYERLKRNDRPLVPRWSRFRHIDGNTMNCRADNLEPIERRPHQAITTIAGVRVNLGSYPSKEDALRACNEARAAVGVGPVKTRNRG